MITRRGLVTWGLFSVLALSLTAPTAGAGTLVQPLALVVAKNSSMQELSLYKLKRLYMGESITAPDGTKLLPLNRGTSTSERVGFDRTVLSMSPVEAARYWIDRRIRGKAGAPKAVDPAGVVQKVVSRLPGSISYVRLQDVTNDVKVLKIDGKSPGDAGYPIAAARGSSAGATSARTGRF